MESAKPKFRCIGKGHCGSVWAEDRIGSSDALKREDGGRDRNIGKDFDMHQRVLSSLDGLQISLASENFSRIHVPRNPRLVLPEESNWWSTMLPRFPTGYMPCRTLISERIQPLPKPIREFLIDTFCSSHPPGLRDLVKTTKSDEDCLVRVYLGRRRFSKRPKRFFSLRNYPLHLDQMEEIGDLDIVAYAKAMAGALAMMHWSSKIDAADVEFVFASPRPGSPSTSIFQSKSLGEHALWILDFDCCNPMSMDEAGIDQAVEAFYKNDHFYPRPRGSEAKADDKELWQVFRRSFLAASALILADDSARSYLPELLMDKIEQRGIRAEGEREGKGDEGDFGM